MQGGTTTNVLKPSLTPGFPRIRGPGMLVAIKAHLTK